jgi:hypothetical protein
LILEGGYNLTEGFRGVRSTLQSLAACHRLLLGEFYAAGFDKGKNCNAIFGYVRRLAERNSPCGHATTIYHQAYCKRRCADHRSIKHLLPLMQPPTPLRPSDIVYVYRQAL